MRKYARLMLLACIVAARGVCADEANVLPFRIAAFVRTNEPPVIDGVIDEPCWQRAGKLTGYRLRGGAGPPNAKTIGYMLFDDANIYLAFHCEEPRMEDLLATLSGNDAPVWLDDDLEIFLAPPDSAFLKKQPPQARYYHIAVNPAGARYDEVGVDSPASWNGTWKAATSDGPDSWSAELAIPFSDLGVASGEGRVWRVNFHRVRQPEKELSSWSEVPLSFHDTSRFGRAIFLDAPPPGGVPAADSKIAVRVIRQTEVAPSLAAARDAKQEALAAMAKMAAIPSAQDARNELADAVARLDRLAQAISALDDASLLAKWRQSVQELTATCSNVSRLAGLAEAYALLSEQLASGNSRMPALLTFVMPAITNAKLDPRAYPEKATPADEIVMRACPREYESATFVIYALESAERVRVRAGELKGPADASIPADLVNIRVVKFWYQSGTSIVRGETVLTPELLLKDDGLVIVDHDKQRNRLRDPEAPRDSNVLLPVDIPAGSIKQFWITLWVPPGTPPGRYEGPIFIKPAGKHSIRMTLSLDVLPFELGDPILDYAIYYRGRLSDRPTISSELKSRTQYLAELRNMLQHGIDNPTIYDGISRLDEVLSLRDEAGLPKKPLLFLGRNAGMARTEEERSELKRDVKKTLEIAKKHGISEVYFYGIDEATGERLKAERASFQACHEAGGKVFVACYRGFFDVVGDLLDLPVMSGPTPWHVEQVHALGRKMYNYGAPQCGVEEPETYRRNFGLRLWKLKFDGACDYAYQHDFGEGIWDDFDTEGYRDHNMTYQTIDGVVDTIQWEGWREGVDDVRYLSTLLKAIEAAKAAGGKEALVTEAETWLENLDISGDLDEIRAGMIERILKLR